MPSHFRHWRSAMVGAMILVLKFFGLFVLMLIVVPIMIGAALNYAKGSSDSAGKASWSSSGLLPKPTVDMPASIIVLSSRTGSWPGIFADHMSIVLKSVGAAKWTRYDVVGWGSPVRKDSVVADAFWFGNAPRKIYELYGDEAAQLIPKIEANIAAYPYQKRGSYVMWPGPNSNSFVGWVIRQTPGFNVELSSVAVGKDYLGPGFGFGPAASHSGYTLSIAGYFGLTLAREEGIELHLLGSTIGIAFNDFAIKLPALGKLSLSDMWAKPSVGLRRELS